MLTIDGTNWIHQIPALSTSQPITWPWLRLDNQAWMKLYPNNSDSSITWTIRITMKLLEFNQFCSSNWLKEPTEREGRNGSYRARMSIQSSRSQSSLCHFPFHHLSASFNMQAVLCHRCIPGPGPKMLSWVGLEHSDLPRCLAICTRKWQSLYHRMVLKWFKGF